MTETSTVVKIRLASSAPGYIKVRLQYLTKTARHLRSTLLFQCGAKPPFMEEVCVLLPHKKVYPLRECFLPIFEALRTEGIVSPDAILQEFNILDRDYLTLAYLL